MLRRHMKLLLVVLAIVLVPVTAWATVRFNRYSTAGVAWDAARTPFTLRAINFTAATTEGMITLTPSRDYVDAATGTSFAVTAAKRMRILGACISVKNAGAAVQGVQVRVRINPSGAAVSSSPVIVAMGEGTESATANVAKGNCTPIDQDFAMELSGTNQIGVSQIGTGTAGNDFILWGYEYTP